MLPCSVSGNLLFKILVYTQLLVLEIVPGSNPIDEIVFLEIKYSLLLHMCGNPFVYVFVRL